MKLLSGKWPPSVNGAMLAFFVMLMLYLFNDTVGMSDGMLVFSNYCCEIVEEGSLESPPELDWQLGFLGGIFVGALASALMSGGWKFQINQKGGASFLNASWQTIICGLGGGFLVMVGLQLCGESFFGQFASAMQLSTGAWIFLFITFIVGMFISILWERADGGGEED